MATDENDYKEALERFDAAQDLDREQRKLAIEDLLFIHSEDGQWADDVVEKRADRPRFTIDRISGAVDQVIGDQRQTRKGPKVTPEKDGDDKGAEIRKGLIRSIEALSKADTVYDNAFMEQMLCGYGGWRIYTTYEGETTFDQVIRMGMLRSAASTLFFDTEAERYSKSDSGWAWYITHMTTSTFKKMFPDAAESDFGSEMYKTEQRRDWFGERGIRLAEYWTREEYDKKLGLMTDGRVIDLDEEKDVLDELYLSGVGVKDERKVKCFKVYRRLMNGAEFLTDKEEWAGKYIPLIPVYGKYAVIEGNHYVRGMVRKAKDAQRIYNYATSAAIEAAALTPKNPYFITPEELGDFKAQWQKFNTKNPPYMLFNPDPAMGGSRPMRDQGAPINPALIQQIQQAATDIHSTTGIEPASLGNVPELKSGKAILAQQAMGDRGSYVYQSNFERSMAHSYEVIGDLLGKIYDTERVEKILGNEDQPEEIVINQRATDQWNQTIVDRQTGKEVLVNDLTQGNYSYSVSSSPAQHTRREETVEQLTNIAKDDPELRAMTMDLIIDNMELNNKEEIKKRVRKMMIQKGLVEPTEDEIKEFKLDQQQPDPMQQELVRNLQAQTDKLMLEQQELISTIENKEAGTQKLIAETHKAIVDSFKTSVEAIVAKLDAGMPITPDDTDVIEGQAAMVEEYQIDTLENQQQAGSSPMDQKPPGQMPMQPQGMPSNPQGEMQNTPIVTIPGPNEI